MHKPDNLLQVNLTLTSFCVGCFRGSSPHSVSTPDSFPPPLVYFGGRVSWTHPPAFPTSRVLGLQACISIPDSLGVGDRMRAGQTLYQQKLHPQPQTPVSLTGAPVRSCGDAFLPHLIFYLAPCSCSISLSLYLKRRVHPTVQLLTSCPLTQDLS